MQEKFKDFQILHGREEKVNPKLTAYQVELVQVEAEIEKLLDTLTRPMRLCLPMATEKFEESDTRRQAISKAIAELLYIMEERTETVTRRRRQSGLWGKICGAFGTSDWGWETYKEDVSRSVININTVRKEVMSLTRAYFGELQASIEQDINQPVRQEIDAFFCAFREKVEQLRNTLIQSSEDHKRDQQAQERLTRRLQALNERVPELITDSKALREELETML